MNPMTIQVRPLPTLRWRNRRAMEQLASALTALGYQDEGSHQILELPHFQLQLFHHPTVAAFAMVLGSPEGVWAEFCSATQAGTGADFTSFTATNTSSPNVGVLDKPPGVVVRKLPGLSVKELHAEFLKGRPQVAWRPGVPGGCARLVEESYAFEMKWRNDRGGPTSEEVARVARLPKPRGQRKPIQELFHLLEMTRLLDSHRRRPPTTLTGAIKSGDVTLVRRFLDAGFPVEERTVGFHSPLGPAASSGNLEIVDLLLSRGAQPSPGGIFTPVGNAAEKGHLAVLKRLVQAGADLATDGPRALRAAAEKGKRETVEYLLGQGVPLDRDYTAALSVAAGHGHVEILESLFRAGASTNQAGKALQWAAVHGQYPAARWLVQRGVDPRNHPQYGTDLFFQKSRRPLVPERLAKEEGYPILARFLAGKPVDEIQAMAEVPVSQSEAELAAELSQLQEALSGPRLEGAMREGAVLRILELIRSREVSDDLNQPDRRRGYALTLAAGNGDLEVVKALVEAGAVVNPPGKRSSPLYAAVEQGHLEVARFLLGAGAQVQTPGTSDSALFAAVEWGDPALVKLILEAGADPTTKNRLDKTPSALVQGLHQRDIKRLLLQAAQARGFSAPLALLFRRGKRTVDLKVARGTRAFQDSHPGNAEWAVVGVRAPGEAVAREWTQLSKAVRWEANVAEKPLGPVAQSHFVLQLAQQDWSLILLSVGWVTESDLQLLPSAGAELSRVLETTVLTFAAEDTSSCEEYELFEQGRSVEKASWDGQLQFRSVRPGPKPKFGKTFPDPVFSDLGIYLPVCGFVDDGLTARLSLEGLRSADVVRLDRIVVRE